MQHRLIKALSDIVESLQEERSLFVAFQEQLLKNEWTLREHRGETIVDSLKKDLGEYIEFIETVELEAKGHLDSVLDGATLGDLCDRMDAFSQTMARRRTMQKHVGDGVGTHLKGLPEGWESDDDSDLA